MSKRKAPATGREAADTPWKSLPYVLCLNLVDDVEYMQNTQFSVDLRQKQIDVQNEVGIARRRLSAVNACIETLNKLVQKRFAIQQYNAELSRKKDERDRKAIVKRIQAAEGQLGECAKGVDEAVVRNCNGGDEQDAELARTATELRRLLHNSPPAASSGAPAEGTAKTSTIVDKLVEVAARAFMEKGVVKSNANAPMNTLRSSIPVVMESCETADDLHTLSQVSAHMMILAEMQSAWKNRETSLSGKQSWLTVKIDEMDEKISARVRTAFKRASVKKHPDKLNNPTAEDYAAFEDITNARDVLTDSASRQQYFTINNHAEFVRRVEERKKGEERQTESGLMGQTRRQKEEKKDKLAIMGGEPGRCTKPYVSGVTELGGSSRRVLVTLTWACHSTAVPVHSYRLEASFGGAYGYETVYKGEMPTYSMEILPVEEILFRACAVNNMGEGEMSVPLGLHPQDLETKRMAIIRLRNERREQMKEEQMAQRLQIETELRELLFTVSAQRPNADNLMKLAEAMDEFVAHRCNDKDLMTQTKEQLRKMQMSLEERELVSTWRSSLKALAKSVADEDDDLVLADEQIRGMAKNAVEDADSSDASEANLIKPDINKLKNACGFHALLVSLDKSLPPTVRNMVAQYVLSALERMPRHPVVRDRLVKLCELALTMDEVFTKKNLIKIRAECERIRRAPPYVVSQPKPKPERRSPVESIEASEAIPQHVAEVTPAAHNATPMPAPVGLDALDISAMSEEEQLALAEKLSLMTFEEDQQRLIAAGLVAPVHGSGVPVEVLLSPPFRQEKENKHGVENNAKAGHARKTKPQQPRKQAPAKAAAPGKPQQPVRASVQQHAQAPAPRQHETHPAPGTDVHHEARAHAEPPHQPAPSARPAHAKQATSATARPTPAPAAAVPAPEPVVARSPHQSAPAAKPTADASKKIPVTVPHKPAPVTVTHKPVPAAAPVPSKTVPVTVHATSKTAPTSVPVAHKTAQAAAFSAPSAAVVGGNNAGVQNPRRSSQPQAIPPAAEIPRKSSQPGSRIPLASPQPTAKIADVHDNASDTQDSSPITSSLAAPGSDPANRYITLQTPASHVHASAKVASQQHLWASSTTTSLTQETGVDEEDSFWGELHNVGMDTATDPLSTSATQSLSGLGGGIIGATGIGNDQMWMNTAPSGTNDIEQQLLLLESLRKQQELLQQQMLLLQEQSLHGPQAPTTQEQASVGARAPGPEGGADESAVAEFLSQLGMKSYITLFEQEDIDMSTLRILDESDLEQLGLPKNARITLLNAIQHLKQSDDAAQTGLDSRGFPSASPAPAPQPQAQQPQHQPRQQQPYQSQQGQRHRHQQAQPHTGHLQQQQQQYAQQQQQFQSSMAYAAAMQGYMQQQYYTQQQSTFGQPFQPMQQGHMQGYGNFGAAAYGGLYNEYTQQSPMYYQ